MPPKTMSKKNVPTETDQEEHHHDEDNEISLTPEPSHTTDQERRVKLEALQKARAEKIAHNHSKNKMLMKMMTRLSTEN
jgi:hypothetical protein